MTSLIFFASGLGVLVITLMLLEFNRIRLVRKVYERERRKWVILLMEDVIFFRNILNHGLIIVHVIHNDVSVFNYRLQVGETTPLQSPLGLIHARYCYQQLRNNYGKHYRKQD